MEITSINIKNSIREKAFSLGFEKIGFAAYKVLEKESLHLEKWLKSGYDADMVWIKKGLRKRRDIRNILPDAKSVISLAYNYYSPIEHDVSKPKISRYAWGRDYHKVLKKKLKEMMKSLPLPDDTGKVTGLYYVDDGPVMDKAWAVHTGIGWQGKHSNVINPEFGSWFFICTIITNIEFDSYDSPIEDQCGSCTLCISACPTGAIVDEYVVDSNKCISYHTIENRGEIPDSIDLNGWVFGCDVCQDVCPFNSPRHNRVTKDENFYPLPALKEAGELNKINEDQFDKIFTSSPVKRTKFKGWKRNLGHFHSPL